MKIRKQRKARKSRHEDGEKYSQLEDEKTMPVEHQPGKGRPGRGSLGQVKDDLNLPLDTSMWKSRSSQERAQREVMAS